MTHDLECLFICLFTICISLVRLPLRAIFCPFLVSFLLSFKSSLYTLDKNSFLDLSFANISFPVCGLFDHFPNIVFHRAEAFHLSKPSLSIMSFMAHVFGTGTPEESLHNQSHLGL